MNTTLTFEEGASRKFYSLTLAQNVVTIQFGRLGTPGQTQVKTLDSEGAAQKLYNTLLAQKRKKGYVPSNDTPEVASGTPSASGEAKASPASRTSKAAAVSKAAELKKAAPKKAVVPLPSPALEDPPVPGLDLAHWRQGEVPVPQGDSTPLPSGDFVIEGYSISLGEGGELVVKDARGKVLKNPPDKLRKHEDYQALVRGRKDDRSRVARARRVLEERMISGAPFSGDELAWLVEDDVFAPLLRGVLVRPLDRPGEAGLLVAWEARGLGVLPLDYDARWLGWASVELLHPMKLADVTPWQDLLIDVGLQQALVQLFREVRSVPTAQRSLTESSLLGGRQTRSGASVERALMEEGWAFRRGQARRKLSERAAQGVTAVEAWFDYGEYYMPAEPTTTGAFGFFHAETSKPLKFNEVPPVLLSEAIRSLELCLAQSGAGPNAQAADEAEGQAADEAEGQAEDGAEAASDADADEDSDDVV